MARLGHPERATAARPGPAVDFLSSISIVSEQQSAAALPMALEKSNCNRKSVALGEPRPSASQSSMVPANKIRPCVAKPTTFPSKRMKRAIVIAWALVCKACNRTRYGRWGGLWSRWLRAACICRRLQAAGPGSASGRFWRVTDAGGSREGKGGHKVYRLEPPLGKPRSQHLSIMSGICALEHVTLDCRAAC